MAYKRVLLKVTGEAFKGEDGIIDARSAAYFTQEILQVVDGEHPVELAIVVGGGNIVRGDNLIKSLGIPKSLAHYAGMTATMINGLLLEGLLVSRLGWEKVRLMNSLDIQKASESFFFKRACSHLQKGRIVILAGGTGVPGVTTDTAAVQLAAQIEAEVVLKGTKVDFVCDRDPKNLQNGEQAIAFQDLTWDDFIAKKLTGILDLTAVAQAKTDKLPIIVFNFFKSENFARLLAGVNIGTRIGSPRY